MKGTEDADQKDLFELLLKRLQDASAGATKSVGIALTLGVFCLIYLLGESGAEGSWRWAAVVRKMTVAQNLALREGRTDIREAKPSILSQANRALVHSPAILIKAGVDAGQVERATQFLRRYDPTPTQLLALASKLESDALNQRSLKVPLLGFDAPNAGIYSFVGVIVLSALGWLWRGLSLYNRTLRHFVSFKKSHSLTSPQLSRILASDTFASQPENGRPHSPLAIYLILVPMFIISLPENLDPAGFSIGLSGAREMLSPPITSFVVLLITVLTFGIFHIPYQNINANWKDIYTDPGAEGIGVNSESSDSS